MSTTNTNKIINRTLGKNIGRHKQLSYNSTIYYAESFEGVEDYINCMVGGVTDSDLHSEFHYPCFVVIEEYYEYPPNSELYDVSDTFISVRKLDAYLDDIANIKSEIESNI